MSDQTLEERVAELERAVITFAMRTPIDEANPKPKPGKKPPPKKKPPFKDSVGTPPVPPFKDSVGTPPVPPKPKGKKS